MNWQPVFISYRIYADGSVVHEDDFDKYYNAQPYYDNYTSYNIPEELVAHISGDIS